MAEGVGFEPTLPFGKPVFKTGAFGRSAIPPLSIYCTASERRMSGRKDLPGLPLACRAVEGGQREEDAVATVDSTLLV